MPTVQFSLADLEHLLGKKVPRDKDELNQLFAYVKGDVDSMDEANETVSIEVKDSNHPDIWSVEGIARALRSFLGLATARTPRVSGASKLIVQVDSRLRSIRPYIACAMVKGVKPTDEALKSWIGLQDKMDQTYGRKRKRASIGYYQADLISSPLRYTVSKPEAASFTPLGAEEEMTLRQIVDSHAKGQEYGPIISRFKEWPLLVDGKGKVLSLPPVINSNNLGHITTETRSILVEVTGTNLETVQDTLKIVVTALTERGGKIHSCTQNYGYPPKRTVTPSLEPQMSEVSLDYANRVLGTRLTGNEAGRYLKKAGYGISKRAGGRLRVQVPCYRLDIMHEVDIVEDIAIAMNLNSLKPEWPRIWTVGGLTSQTETFDRLGEVMIGLGYQELLTYSLSSPQSVGQKMRLPAGRFVELENPKMSTLTILRDWLLPSLLEFLGQNTHVEYPQKVFEIGPCATRSENQAETVHKLAAVTTHDTAGFTEIRGCLDAMLNNVGVEFKVEPEEHPSFLEGRSGVVLVEDQKAGMIGEVHPEVIRNWGLGLPVGAFELDLSILHSLESS